MNREEEIIHWKKKFADMTDEQIRGTMSGWKPHAPGWIAGDMMLQERHAAKADTRPLLQEISSKVAGIDGRLAAVERTKKIPEIRTWSFWLAWIAIAIAALSLLRDYFDVRGRFDAATPAPAEQKPNQSSEPTRDAGTSAAGAASGASTARGSP